jgi:DNA-directed RNA polymerase subunit RPC12/RpoP
MVVIKGRIIAKPHEGIRPIYRKRNDKKSKVPRPLVRGKAGARPIHRKRNDKKRSVPGPLLRGKAGGRLKYICGKCSFLLAYNVLRKEISVDAVFLCPNCNKYNEF